MSRYLEVQGGRQSILTPTGTLANSSAHAFAAGVAGVVLGVAISITVARSLGPQGKGAYDLALSSAALLAIVLGLSLPSGITFAVARGVSSPRALLVSVTLIASGQAAAAWVVLSLLSHTRFASDVGPVTVDSTAAMGLSILVAVLCLAPSLKAILVGEQRVALASWLELVGRATVLVALALAVIVLNDASSIDLILAFLAGSALGVVAFVPSIALGATSGAGAGFRTVFRFAIPSWGANVLQYLNYRLDLFLVAYFRDLREVGLYALAATLAQLLWLASNAAATAVFGRIGSTTTGHDAAAARTASLARMVLAVQICLAVFLAIAARPLVGALYGSAFEQAVPALWLLLPGVTIFGTAGVLAAHLAGLGKPGLNLAVSAASLAVTLTADLLLIPGLGMNGAAVASTLSYGSAALLMAWFFSQATGIRYSTVFLIRRADVHTLVSALRMRTL